MDSFNYKHRKSQSHPFTSYQLARLRGWGFPELVDYTELEACAWYSCHFFPLPLSLPLLSTTTFLTGIKLVTNKSPLIPFSPHSNHLLHHHLPHSSLMLLTPHFLTPHTWKDSHLHPPSKTATMTSKSSQARFSKEALRTEPLWSAWRRLFGSPCYTNSGSSVKETVLPSVLNAAIQPRMWDPPPSCSS